MSKTVYMKEFVVPACVLWRVKTGGVVPLYNEVIEGRDLYNDSEIGLVTQCIQLLCVLVSILAGATSPSVMMRGVVPPLEDILNYFMTAI